MSRNTSLPLPEPGADYAWLREGDMPATREDRIAEIIAGIALVLSMAAGIVIAMLPVSTQAQPAHVAASHPALPGAIDLPPLH